MFYYENDGDKNDSCTEDRIKAFTLGCDDFLVFPMKVEELTARVQSKVQSALRMEKTTSLAYKDELSQLVNRRGYNNALTNEWARCKRNKQSISMLIVDIDNFKEFNDKFGHAKGDELILLAAKTLMTATSRSSDLVARYGGDEFIVLLPDCNQQGASGIADSLVKKFNTLNASHNDLLKMAKFSISIGISSIVPSEDSSASELFGLADNALYQAKQSGKNCWKHSAN
jgi:diguanylate cyclase (GGDEF)-like protein